MIDKVNASLSKDEYLAGHVWIVKEHQGYDVHLVHFRDILQKDRREARRMVWDGILKGWPNAILKNEFDEPIDLNPGNLVMIERKELPPGAKGVALFMVNVIPNDFVGEIQEEWAKSKLGIGPKIQEPEAAILAAEGQFRKSVADSISKENQN